MGHERNHKILVLMRITLRLGLGLGYGDSTEFLYILTFIVRLRFVNHLLNYYLLTYWLQLGAAESYPVTLGMFYPEFV